MTLLLGCIADDFTGATDLALMLGKKGMPVTQYIGVPRDDERPSKSEAVVVALKSRSVPKEKAVLESITACRWLIRRGAVQIFFKYCSTFDSTPQGNIGPVADALLEELKVDQTVVCPSLPVNGRTVYQGHLFVHDRLLSNSSMRDHPLTPMKDSNLVRFMGCQVKDPTLMGLLPFRTVEQGPQAVRSGLEELVLAGKRFVVLDAVTDKHLATLGKACSHLKLITGGSGMAMALPENFRHAGLLVEKSGLVELPSLFGFGGVLVGSCSETTRSQVAHAASHMPAYPIDPRKLALDRGELERIFSWSLKRMSQGPFLIYSSDDPESVSRVQAELGHQTVSEIIESALAEIATVLHENGLNKFVVAGGETAGAVLKALKTKVLRIGPEIEPGIPWTLSEGEPPLLLALKSGNFGGVDFFNKALEMIQ